MNVEETKRCMQLMQSFVDNGSIMVRNNNGEWIVTSSPSWDFNILEYKEYVSVEYMVKVMRAYKCNFPIEIKEKDECSWNKCKDPKWNWGLMDYRIKE